MSADANLQQLQAALPGYRITEHTLMRDVIAELHLQGLTLHGVFSETDVAVQPN